MSKSAGDPKRKAPQSIGEIASELASSLMIQDARFNYFWNYKPIPKLLEPGGFFRSDKKTKALIGGNRSSKSTAGVFEAVMIYTGMIPPSLQGIYPHDIPKNRPRRVRIIVGDYSKRYPETIRPLLLGDPRMGAKGMLPEAWSEWNEEEHMFTGPDGSYLSIIASDPQEEDNPKNSPVLRGPEIDHTYIDEINKEYVWTESLTRGTALKDGPKTVTLGFCPQEGFSCWTYLAIYAACYNTATKQRLPIEKCHPDIFSQTISMRDNPSISPKEIASIISSLKPWEVAYRVNGEYSQRSSNPYFNMEMLTYWEEHQKYSDGEPVRCIEKEVNLELGRFEGKLEPIHETVDFDERYESIWRVWGKPVAGRKYVMTVDSAEGNVDSDYHDADIWDATDLTKPTQAAQLRIRMIKPGEFAVNCACMASVYGNCLMVVETNNTSGGIVIDRIRHYRNLYKRISVKKTIERELDVVGWHTDRFNKGPCLEITYKKLNEFFRRDNGEFNPINSRFTLMEMQAFEERIIRNAKNVSQTVWGARKGEHDDTVSAMSLAFRIMYHEYHKIITCKFSTTVKESYQSLMEKQAQKQAQRSGAFAGMRKAPALNDLRRNAIHGGIRGKNRGRKESVSSLHGVI